ncbi:MAG: Nucleotidyl transferase [Bacteroidetes bacterium]|jgi:dTDP-glucose pyrophosphorylase|nr:Nucleotidyl transferase [Bacteroidota bacterium]
MENFEIFVLDSSCTVADLIRKMEQLTEQITVEKPNIFITDHNNVLLGSVSDGDIRRGIVKGASLNSPGITVMNSNCRFLNEHSYTHAAIKELKNNQVRFVPFLNADSQLIRIVDLTKVKGHLPVDCIIMAGGRGERLRPMTDTLPKPLLQIGTKPIIEHTIDRLIDSGANRITISIRYLGEKIKDYFGDGAYKKVEIHYLEEKDPLGTIGAVSLMETIKFDTVLLMNSDLLTNIDYLEFYEAFTASGADMAVATVPYTVNIPYAILETHEDTVLSLKEKPSFTYQSNAGIYLMKKEILAGIPKNTFYNATDLMEDLIKKGKKLIYYPLFCYWLDIGKPEDYNKAIDDIKHIHL